jgi:hypothetical protein
VIAVASAPPHPWMPGVWDHDDQGLPIRHRPLRPYCDLWESRCGTFLFDFPALRTVMELAPCPLCAADEEP